MMTNRLILIIIVVTEVCGCAPGIHSFDWLQGTWEMPKPNGSYRLETWEDKDRTTMTGRGFKLIGKDTTLLEKIQLHADRKHIWYVPTVADQNNGAPVAFKMVSSTNHQYVFENPQHDFPQRIVYHLKPIQWKKEPVVTIGDTLDVGVTSLDGEGIHFRFTRKSPK